MVGGFMLLRNERLGCQLPNSVRAILLGIKLAMLSSLPRQIPPHLILRFYPASLFLLGIRQNNLWFFSMIADFYPMLLRLYS